MTQDHSTPTIDESTQPTASKSNHRTRRYVAIFGFLIMAISSMILIYSVTSADTTTSENLKKTVVIDSLERISFIAAGDVMSHSPQTAAAWDSACDCFNYADVFQYISPVVKQCDVALVNYETTNGGAPYTGYPQFSSPDTLAWFVQEAGFNFFVNANNHSNDRGLKGNIRTIESFDRYQIKHTGVFKDSNERKATYPYMIKAKESNVAILNYTYGTNGIPNHSPAIVNLIDTLQMMQDLKVATDAKANTIIVFMHWGLEYQTEANAEQKKLADFLFRNGADVIIGSHPHVIQPIEYCNFSYKGKPKTGLVIWSLGNFISNQRQRFTDGGIMVKFDIVRNIYTNKTTIEGVSYIPVWVYRKLNPTHYTILPVSLVESKPELVTMNDEDKNAFNLFTTDTRKHLKRDTVRIKEFFVR